jgi:hypothetical protein
MANGEVAAESSSIGSFRSQDRGYPIGIPSSQGQLMEGPFNPTSTVYRATSLHSSQESAGRLDHMVLEGREDVDQVLLSKYRAEMMPQHPFILVPHHIPASVLRVHHPMLMAAIRVIANFEGLQSMNSRLQIIITAIADRMFRRFERSLDLLMGIVVILGWHHYLRGRPSQLNTLLCLAESLISDLGLNKRPVTGRGEETRDRQTQEKRLLLGVWYLRSS